MALQASTLLSVTAISILVYTIQEEVMSSDPAAANDYCLYERFTPQCAKNEAIMVTAATYGRMRIGRCLTATEVEAQKSTFGDDPRYLGCSEDVLPILDRKCSGKTVCDVRVIDMTIVENVAPCFPGLFGYLEVSYDCIFVADEERSCSVSASAVPTHIIGSHESPPVCGTHSQPWLVEAPVGQKVRIGLFDFSAAHTRQIGEQNRQSCNSYGIIWDKGNKQNISICGGGAMREKEVYTTNGNAAEIFFSSHDRKKGATDVWKFMLRIEAVGCLDLIPPEDAWLKRNDDSIVIGCYSSRQTWHLHCEAEKWIGVFGNCSQGQVHDTVMESHPKTETWSDGQVLTMVAVGGFTLTVCLTVLCTGIVCLRRYSAQKKKRYDYRTLNFSMARKPFQPSIMQDNTRNDSHALAAQEMPTHSVYIEERGLSAVDDNSLGYNSNPSVPL